MQSCWHFHCSHSQLNRVEEAIGACEVEGVPEWLMTDFIHTSTSKPDFDAFAGRPMLNRVSAFVALVIMAIPMGIIALVIEAPRRGRSFFASIGPGDMENRS